MPDESVISEVQAGRRRWPLLLAFVPIAAGTVWLAPSPPAIQRAEITADGSYVVAASLIGRNPRRWDVQRRDLRTGEAIRSPQMVESSPNELSTDNRWLAASQKDGQLTSLSLIGIDDFNEVAVPDPSLWKTSPVLLEGQRLIGFEQAGDLRLLDVRAGTDMQFPLPPTNAVRTIVRLKTFDRVLVTERPVGGVADKWRLISLTEPIEQLAEWNSTQYWYPESGEFLYVFNADTDRIEMRRLKDGNVVSEYDVKPLFQQFRSGALATIQPQRHTIVILDRSQNRYLLYELKSHRVVATLPTDLSAGDVSKDESFMIVGQGTSAVGAFDLETRSTRWLHKDWHILRAAQLSPDQSQLIAVFRDGSVKLFDVNTGELLRTHGSQAGVRIVFGCVLAAFVVWCVLWIRAGVRMKAWPLMEAIMLNGLVAVAIILRVNSSGSMEDPYRATYQAAQWLFASWLVLLTCWVVFGKARWTLRLLAPLVGLALTFTLALTNIRGDRSVVWVSVMGAFGVAIIGSLWFGLLRRWGFVAARDDGASSALANVGRSIPLRDLFFITAAVAAILAAVRYVTPHMLAAREVVALVLIATTVSLTGVAATWAGLSHRHWFRRMLLLTLIIVVAGATLPLALPFLRQWEVLQIIGTSQAFIVLFTLGTSLIFRAHGWRLRRTLRS